MAAESVEILIRARNEANQAIAQAIGQLKGLERQGVKSGAAPQLQLVKFADSLGLIPPKAVQATRSLQQLSQTSALMGAVGVGILGVVASLGALSAAVVTGTKNLIDMAAQAEQLSNLAQKTGLTAGAFQALSRFAGEAGVSTESLATGLKFLDKAIASNDKTLRALGVSSRDTQGALTELANVFAVAPDGPEKTALAVKVLGKSGSDLIPVLNQGGAAMEDFLRRANPEGLEQVNKALLDFDRSVDIVHRSMDQLKDAFLITLSPSIRFAADAIRTFITFLLTLPQTVVVTITSLQIVGNAFDAFVRSLVERVPGASQALAALGLSTADAADRQEKAYGKLLLQIDTLVKQSKDLVDSMTPMPHVLEEGSDAAKHFADGVKTLGDNAAKTKQSLEEMLRVAAIGTEGTAAGLRGLGPGIGGGFQKLPVPDLQHGPTGEFFEMVEHLRDAMDSLTSSGAIALGALDALRVGLEIGFSSVFVGLLDKTQTWGTALKKIWDSILASLLADLGARVGDKILGGILDPVVDFIGRFIPFLEAGRAPGVAFAVGGGPSGNVLPPGASFARVPSVANVTVGPVTQDLKDLTRSVDQLRKQIAAPAPPVNVSIQALDSQSFDEYMHSPTGKGLFAERRRAQTRDF